jgi:hypothetical protein
MVSRTKLTGKSVFIGRGKTREASSTNVFERDIKSFEKW